MNVTNVGSIAGGAGSLGVGGNEGNGGDGVDLAAGSILVNHGLITGALSPFYRQTSINGTGAVLGAGATVSNTGTIANGIVFSAGGTLVNHGLINGGKIPLYGAAGIYPAIAGVEFAASAIIDNAGTIVGGSLTGVDVDLLAGGTLTNTGTITGLQPNPYYTQEAPGGAVGVFLGGAALVTNRGTITAGAGEADTRRYGSAGGTGGIGIDLSAGGTLTNGGVIRGGDGGQDRLGGTAGAGVVLGQAGFVTNTGTIAAGYGAAAGGHDTAGLGASGLVFAAGGTLINRGLVEGMSGVVFAGSGTVTNLGILQTMSPAREDAPGGAALKLLAGGTVSNLGTISGGRYAQGGKYPGGEGGNGLVLDGAGSVVNHGTISGGEGQYGGNASDGGPGGAGVILSGADTMRNIGVVLGGDGGFSNIGVNGAGGAGAELAGGALLYDSGIIDGGAAAQGKGTGSPGGVGVYVSGGTLSTNGTISGALSSPYPGNLIYLASSVQFGSLAGTLMVAAGAVFHGDITGNPDADDTLVLQDSKFQGTLSGFGGPVTEFGTAVNGFATVVEDAHANWILSGTLASGFGTLVIDTGATLAFAGTASIPIAFGQGGNEAVSLANPADVTSTFSGFGTGDSIGLQGIQANSLSYGAGTLTLFENHDAVDTLSFAGQYTASDFALAQIDGGVAVVYAGNNERNDPLAWADLRAGSPPDAEWHAMPHPN